MSKEKARAHLEKYGYADRIRELDVSSATVALAAAALGTEEQRIAKTLSFAVGDGSVLVVTAGDVKIDNKKFKTKFQAKARMLSPSDVESIVGHAVGGVCPFGVNEGIDVYLDVSLKRFETVFPAAGASNNAVEMTVAELERASEYKEWVDVTRPEESC